jgi:tRNA-dihydrouridine synthase A
VHARKAVLGGLSPHENRTVPPLRFDAVAGLRTAFPAVPVIVNGGVRTCEAAVAALARFDGVMIGREAYHHPLLLAQIEAALHPDRFTPPAAEEVLERMRTYAEQQQARGTPLQAITRHMLGLMSGQPGAKALRQVLSRDVVEGLGAQEVFRRAAELARAACFP